MSRIVRNFANFLKEDVEMPSEEMMDVNPDEQNVADVETEPKAQMAEEEEGGEYIGQTMMKELSDKLGVQYDGGPILYNDQEINFFSETEKFHIGNKKFSTTEEVVKFLTK